MEQYNLEEFKKNNNITNGKSLYAFLINLGLDPQLINQNNYNDITIDDDKKINANTLFYEYFNMNCENRVITIMNKDGETTIHIGTNGERNIILAGLMNENANSTACLIVIKKNELVISEAHYNRVGNGFNQWGTTITKILSNNNGKIKSTDMRVTVGPFEDNIINLVYCEATSIDSLGFVVDPITLEVSSQDSELTYRINLSLELLRKQYLQGWNKFDANVTKYPIDHDNTDYFVDHEDLEFLSKMHAEKAKVNIIN